MDETQSVEVLEYHDWIPWCNSAESVQNPFISVCMYIYIYIHIILYIYMFIYLCIYITLYMSGTPCKNPQPRPYICICVCI